LRLSDVVCSLGLSRREKMMWRRVRNSFKSREHFVDYVLAFVGAVLLSGCVGLLLVAWFVL
jgi:hypothetical protein